jgi:hypothetical protein
MKRAIVAAAILGWAGCVGLENPPETEVGSAESAISPVALQHRRVCDLPAPGNASCKAWQNMAPDGSGSGPGGGYSPADLLSAYKLPSNGGSGTQIIGIVDAFDDPTAEADLGVYRAQFNLPACTTANGCFKKVGQTGTSSLPKVDAGWAQEISLDLDMASAICPNCKIVLVEANSAQSADLAAAVDTAVNLGATVVSNSYGSAESSNDATYESHYNHPGVMITVSAGDSDYGVQFPAASQYVTAVGGTTLNKDTSARGWTETVWSNSANSGTGSGCSQYHSKPSWQKDTGCAGRTVADVSAVADPYTGVSIYDSTAKQGQSGWMVFGGTIAASPIIAAIYALAGSGSTDNYASYTYANTGSLNDVTAGSNGTCSPAYLCTGEVGYDGPTGNGTPNGLAAFGTGSGACVPTTCAALGDNCGSVSDGCGGTLSCGTCTSPQTCGGGGTANVCGGGSNCTHADGLGQSYTDCTDALGTPGTASTYNATMATDAAMAWASGSVTTGQCGNGQNTTSVKFLKTSTQCAAWQYTGALAGYVHLSSNTTCYCPVSTDPTWN